MLKRERERLREKIVKLLQKSYGLKFAQLLYQLSSYSLIETECRNKLTIYTFHKISIDVTCCVSN